MEKKSKEFLRRGISHQIQRKKLPAHRMVHRIRNQWTWKKHEK